jgi:enoyl-CoA hydratase
MASVDAAPKVLYEEPAAGIVRLVLNRPEMWNAQDMDLLYQVDAGLQRAGLDSAVKAVVVAARGDHFSALHDRAGFVSEEGMHRVTLAGRFDLPGVEGTMSWEEEAYLGLCWRWRNFPKPTIVAVQGRAWAGGLMLVWPFDIVIASEDASFCDPTVGFGCPGVEYFAHAFELPTRIAKEFLFTGREILADEARDLHMVNRVVRRAELESAALDMAIEIAKRPSFGLKLSKASINQAVEAQGMFTALQSAFSIHTLSHAQCRLVHDSYIDPNGAVLAPRFGPPSGFDKGRH